MRDRTQKTEVGSRNSEFRLQYRLTAWFALLALVALACDVSAQVPQLINYQGRVAVSGVNFEGTGQFKFALVNTVGSTTYWSNDGTSAVGSQPAQGVPLSVAGGLYSVLLGDTTLANMTAIPAASFTNSDVRLRVWFNDGTNGWQLLTPDQHIAAVGYAMVAGSVPDGAITSAKLAPGAVATNLAASGQAGVASGGVILSATENPTLIAAGYVKLGTIQGGDAWQQRVASGSPSARSQHSAIWTGSEMIVWGGQSGSAALNDGARFNPVTNTWTSLATANAPSARVSHTAIWTGTEMIVWAGQSGSYLNDGGRYNPATNSWTTLNTANAPAARSGHTAVWTGTEMIAWGGSAGATFFNDGGRFNPTTNAWSAINTSGAPVARTQHTAAWTGTEVIIWGGVAANLANLGTGSRYNPTTNFWTAISTTASPVARYSHTALWAGSYMIIWGGYGSTFLNDGGFYYPAANAWLPFSSTGAPAARSAHVAVWTGNAMIVWGGSGTSGAMYDGGFFDPVANAWSPLTTIGAPAYRTGHTVVWTGSEMIVSCGQGSSGFLGDTWSYAPGKTLVLYQKP